MEKERERINVKRSSPPFPASKIVTKVNKVPICTFAQIGRPIVHSLIFAHPEEKPHQYNALDLFFFFSLIQKMLLALSSLEIHIFVDFLLLSILWVNKFPWHVFLAFLCWISGA